MVYNDFTKQRIVYYLHQGHCSPTIADLINDEGISVTCQGVAKFIKRFLATGTIAWKPGSGRKTKISDEIKDMVEAQMRRDDETTASQLHVLLRGLGYQLSMRTMLR